jgi:hypothetical protein
MGLRDKLSQAGNYLRELRRSRAPDSYAQYKWDRRNKREQADRAREHARESAELAREKTEREHGYEARYEREREGDIAREGMERSEEPDR